MQVRTLFIKYRNKEGKEWIQEHRAWDADRFLASQSAQYRKEGGVAELTTQDAYLEQRNKAKK